MYVETTIVSYLAARPSRNLIVRAHQELTRRWWRQRAAFEVFASPLVVEEAGRGDVAARIRRQRFLRDLPLLEIPAPAEGLRLGALLRAAGLAASGGEANRKIAERAVRVDGVLTEDRDLVFRSGAEHLLQLGKRGFARVRLVSA